MTLIALLAWLYLAFLHGRFWQSGPTLAPAWPLVAPPVAVVVPARDEAELIARSIGSLLAQDYSGELRIVLVDDGSADATVAIARSLPGAERLTVIKGASRPAGWAGKLWAVQQGVAAADAELVLLTDADIEHDAAHVSTLVAQIEESGVDMVSEMVALNCESFAERALVPAFVYFFAMLYPFEWVNDPLRATAAAAGGAVLIRRRALERIGGIGAIRGGLIDDVALARAVKRGGRIWLGHSGLARSIRRYPGFPDIWRMVTRSAFVQLRYSLVLLLLTTFGLLLVFVVPPHATLVRHDWMGLVAWVLMGATFLPTLRRFRLSPVWAAFLPVIALFYLAATVASASSHYFGPGVVWKRRAYSGSGA